MFEYLNDYNTILVVGPQRSGTRICAEMIAYDNSIEYVDEIEYNTYDVVYWLGMVGHGDKKVIQSPAMTWCAHIPGERSDVAVIMMYRKLEDIFASQKRIEWGNMHRRIELAHYQKNYGEPAIYKYLAWESWQKKLIVNAYDVHYESLKEHPLHIDAKDRINFVWSQTKKLTSEPKLTWENYCKSSGASVVMLHNDPIVYAIDSTKENRMGIPSEEYLIELGFSWNDVEEIDLHSLMQIPNRGVVQHDK